jgi:hypothetical protein
VIGPYQDIHMEFSVHQAPEIRPQILSALLNFFFAQITLFVENVPIISQSKCLKGQEI